MSEQERRRRESPQSDLRAVAAHAVRLYVEVACGRRPPRTMTSLATPLAAAQLQEAAARARDDQRPGRIHRIALRRPTRDSAEVTALIRDHEGRVSAMTMQLQQVGRRWQIADVAQLDRGHHHTHAQAVADHRTPTEQLAERRFDVAVLRGAAAAVEQRARTADAPEQGAGDVHARGLWDAAAKLLDGYRTRWNVTDPVNALGTVPPRGTQRDDRKRTLTRVSGLVREIKSLERQLDRQPLAKRLEPGLDGP